MILLILKMPTLLMTLINIYLKDMVIKNTNLSNNEVTYLDLAITITDNINHMIKGKTLISQLLIIQIYKVTFLITLFMVYLHPKSYDIVLLIYAS